MLKHSPLFEILIYLAVLCFYLSSRAALEAGPVIPDS